MARGLNKVMIIGLVDRLQEIRHAQDGQPVTSFSVSAKRHWTTHAGEPREATEWFNVVAWGDLAEATHRWLHQGQRIYAEGYLQTRRWQSDGGRPRFRTEVVANRLIPLGDEQVVADDDVGDNGKELPLCLNCVTVIGNLGRDPEMRYTPHGQAVTSFSLAASRQWTSADGERQDATEWFNVVSWGNLAEICNQYLAKGRRVYVEGELRTRSWDDANGQKHLRTELVANEMILLGPRPKNGDNRRLSATSQS